MPVVEASGGPPRLADGRLYTPSGENIIIFIKIILIACPSLRGLFAPAFRAGVHPGRGRLAQHRCSGLRSAVCALKHSKLLAWHHNRQHKVHGVLLWCQNPATFGCAAPHGYLRLPWQRGGHGRSRGRGHQQQKCRCGCLHGKQERSWKRDGCHSTIAMRNGLQRDIECALVTRQGSQFDTSNTLLCLHQTWMCKMNFGQRHRFF